MLKEAMNPITKSVVLDFIKNKIETNTFIISNFYNQIDELENSPYVEQLETWENIKKEVNDYESKYIDESELLELFEKYDGIERCTEDAIDLIKKYEDRCILLNIPFYDNEVFLNILKAEIDKQKEANLPDNKILLFLEGTYYMLDAADDELECLYDSFIRYNTKDFKGKLPSYKLGNKKVYKRDILYYVIKKYNREVGYKELNLLDTFLEFKSDINDDVSIKDKFKTLNIPFYDEEKFKLALKEEINEIGKHNLNSKDDLNKLLLFLISIDKFINAEDDKLTYLYDIYSLYQKPLTKNSVSYDINGKEVYKIDIINEVIDIYKNKIIGKDEPIMDKKSNKSRSR